MIFLSKWYKSKHWQFLFPVISDHPRVLKEYVGLFVYVPLRSFLTQGIIIIICIWCRQHACIPFVAFFFFAGLNSQSQKMRGTHSIPASERKSAKERVMQRQNKQISKHFFFIKTSNVLCDETACCGSLELTHWQLQTYDEKKGVRSRKMMEGREWEKGMKERSA